MTKFSLYFAFALLPVPAGFVPAVTTELEVEAIMRKKNESKYLPSITIILIALSLALSSCGSGGGNGSSGEPYIYAELLSYSNPASGVASVTILDDFTGAPIPGATVTMNSVTLAYNATDEEYQGQLLVAPGNTVTVNVTVNGKTYTASGQQFTSYPVISNPAAGGTWPIRCFNAVTWSHGSPGTDTFFGVGVLDSATEAVVWPVDGIFQIVQTTTTSYSIPGSDVSVGNREVVVGIAKSIEISGAAPGSELILSGFDRIPIAVADVNANLVSIELSPADWPIAKGMSQQFGATGRYCDGTTQNLTTSVNWGSSDTDIATISNTAGSNGRATPVSSGSTTITGTLGGVTGSTSLTVTNWTLRSTPTTHVLTNVVWSGTQSQFVAVGWAGTILTSPDGMTWTSRNSGTYYELDDIVWSGSQYVVVGQVGTILTSPDGVTWTKRISGTTESLWNVAWSGSKFVVVGGYGTILTSADGITWAPQESGTTMWLSGIAWSGSKFVAVGGSGIFLTSDDGSSWTAGSFGDIYGRYSVTWSGNKFIALGSHESISISSDGSMWTTFDPGRPMTDIVWTGTKFLAAGEYYYIYSSPDCINWTSEFSGSRQVMMAIGLNGTITIILQGDGTVLTSP